MRAELAEARESNAKLSKALDQERLFTKTLIAELEAPPKKAALPAPPPPRQDVKGSAGEVAALKDQLRLSRRSCAHYQKLLAKLQARLEKGTAPEHSDARDWEDDE
ncbi:MAG: hypothetical protein FWG17_02930 [Desulfovibrionaceae bacterium]|nr:hypothetical protein [Desulfovibrionaceae bacterium]